MLTLLTGTLERKIEEEARSRRWNRRRLRLGRSPGATATLVLPEALLDLESFLRRLTDHVRLLLLCTI